MIRYHKLNHYYPYGGLFSEGTANTNQPYKFGDKELDRMNSLDLYDFGARMLDSATPTWGTQDPMAEKYYSISPYSYCGGNPISRIDPNGMDWVMARYNDESFYFYDSRIHSQNDVASNFGDDTEIAYAGESATVYTQNGKKGFNKYELNSDGSFSKNGKAQSSEYNNDGSLHIGSDKFTNNKTINANLYGSYLGPDNPSFNNAGDSYAVPPTNSLDYGAYLHDKRYDAKNAKGINGALLNTDVIGADAKLAAYRLWDSRTTFNLKRSMVASATSYLFIY